MKWLDIREHNLPHKWFPSDKPNEIIESGTVITVEKYGHNQWWYHVFSVNVCNAGRHEWCQTKSNDY